MNVTYLARSKFDTEYSGLIQTAAAIINNSTISVNYQLKDPDYILCTFLSMSMEEINVTFRNNFKNIFRYFLKQQLPYLSSSYIYECDKTIIPSYPVFIWHNNMVLFITYSQKSINKLVDALYGMMVFVSEQFVGSNIREKSIKELELESLALVNEIKPRNTNNIFDYLPKTSQFNERILAGVVNPQTTIDPNDLEVLHSRVKDIWTYKNKPKLTMLSNFYNILSVPARFLDDSKDAPIPAVDIVHVSFKQAQISSSIAPNLITTKNDVSAPKKRRANYETC